LDGRTLNPIQADSQEIYSLISETIVIGKLIYPKPELGARMTLGQRGKLNV
jgi:hypothetical protein